MAPLQYLFVVLLLSSTSGAQKDEIPAQNSNSTSMPSTGNQTAVEHPKPVPLQAPVIIGTPATTAQPGTPVPTNLTRVAVEDRKIAKKIEGSPEHAKVLIAEPDLMRKVLGSRCSGNSDCLSIENTSCLNGLCDCNTGFIPSKHSLDKCLRVPSGLGDTCEEEAQCSHAVPSSDCKDSKCVCSPNYVFGQGRCWEKQTLGGFCNITLQCEDITFAACAQGVCACESPLIPSPANKCLQPAGDEYQAQCVEDIQCTFSYGDEARCSNGQCRCTNNYHYNGTKCIPDKNLGEICLIDEDCAVSEINNQEGSRMCLKNGCTCATGFNSLPGEDICSKSSGEELAVSLTWVLCIVVAKYYLS